MQSHESHPPPPPLSIALYTSGATHTCYKINHTCGITRRRRRRRTTPIFPRRHPPPLSLTCFALQLSSLLPPRDISKRERSTPILNKSDTACISPEHGSLPATFPLAAPGRTGSSTLPFRRPNPSLHKSENDDEFSRFDLRRGKKRPLR